MRNLVYQFAMSLASSKLQKEMFDEKPILLRILPPRKSLVFFFWLGILAEKGFSVSTGSCFLPIQHFDEKAPN